MPSSPGLSSLRRGTSFRRFDLIVASLHEFHFLGIVFAYLVIFMLVMGEISPLEQEFVQEDAGVVEHGAMEACPSCRWYSGSDRSTDLCDLC